MYSYEDRVRAVELYIKLGKRPKAVIRQLGYTTKNVLKAWHRVFQTLGNVHAGYVRRKPKYYDEQKCAAIDHYLNHGRCFAFTRKSLVAKTRLVIYALMKQIRSLLLPFFERLNRKRRSRTV